MLDQKSKGHWMDAASERQPYSRSVTADAREADYGLGAGVTTKVRVSFKYKAEFQAENKWWRSTFFCMRAHFFSRGISESAS